MNSTSGVANGSTVAEYARGEHVTAHIFERESFLGREFDGELLLGRASDDEIFAPVEAARLGDKLDAPCMEYCVEL